MALVDIYLLTLCLWLAPNCIDGNQLCQNCRVNDIEFPLNLPKNLQIVRIVNKYKLVTLDEVKKRNLKTKKSEDFGFIVKIMVNNLILCSGALVAPRLVISSGNCFTKQTIASQVRIILSGGKTLAVAAIHKNEPFAEIGLLTLKAFVSEIKPIPLCKKPFKMGNYADMMIASPKLNYYGRRRTQLISNGVCKARYMQDDSVYITRNMMCLTNSKKSTRCVTIRGDALLLDHHLCGINIYGSKCGSFMQNADLYANIFIMKPYINGFIKKLSG